MPVPTANTKIIAAGAWVRVRVRETAGGAIETIGLCTDASYNESFSLQEANVLGYLGPVSIDSQNYRCTIQIGSFVPEVEGLGDYGDGGDTTLSDMASTRSQVMANGKGKTFTYLEFFNQASNSVINAFAHVIVADAGARINPNSYVTGNMSFQAMERTL